MNGVCLAHLFYHVSWLLAALAVAFLLACSSAFISKSFRFGNYVATKDVSPRKTKAAFLMLSCDTRGFNLSTLMWFQHQLRSETFRHVSLDHTKPSLRHQRGYSLCGDSNPRAMMWFQSGVSATHKPHMTCGLAHAHVDYMYVPPRQLHVFCEAFTPATNNTQVSERRHHTFTCRCCGGTSQNTVRVAV